MKFLVSIPILALMNVGVSTTAQSDIFLSHSKVHSVVRGGTADAGKHNIDTHQNKKFINGRKLTDEDVMLEWEENSSNASENEDEEYDNSQDSPNSDEDKSSDDKMKKKAPKRRECKISEDKDEVDFKCRSKTENEQDESEIEDQIEYKVKASRSGVSIKVEYEQEIETADMETESETQFEVFFDRIVEYVKVDPNAVGEELAYDWDNDEIIQTIEFANLNDFTEIETDEDGVVSHFSVSTEDELVAFTFTVSRAAQGEAVTANKMKIDFRLAGFPWNRTDSYVALLSEVESEREMKVEHDDEKKQDRGEVDENEEKKSRKAKDVVINFEEVLDVSGFTPFGEYTWAETAEVTTVVMNNETLSDIMNRSNTDLGTVVTSRSGGGVSEGVKTETKTVSVVATSATASERRLNGKASQMIAFSFVGDGAHFAPDLFWDPEAGVAYDTSSDESQQGGGDSSFIFSSSAYSLSFSGMTTLMLAAVLCVFSLFGIH